MSSTSATSVPDDEIRRRKRKEELSALTLSTRARRRPDDHAPRQFHGDNPDTERGHAGIGHAHGKAILLGEHAVIYGVPALAIPIPQMTVTATAVQVSHPPAGSDEVTFTKTSPAPEPVTMQATDGLQRLVTEFKAKTGVVDTSCINVLIDCPIPPGRGLGSSAACARAVVVALADLFDRRLDARTVFDLVQTAENVVHGRASGIDALATGSPSPILFSSGSAEELRIPFDGLFVIADSGVASNTKDAVESLRHGFEQNPGSRAEFVHQASRLTHAAVGDLARGQADDFGERLTRCHELLSGAGLSTGRIDALVDAALAAGSLGAKITGGGLGGCMIALVDEPSRAEVVVRRLHEAGAVQTWLVPVGKLADHAC